MARNKRSIKIISAFLSVIFLFQQVVWAAGDTHVPAARNVMSLTSDAPLDPPIQITLPSELAETETSRIGSNGETIINIQDCHSSLTAQYSIARILGELVRNYDVRLVAVEGGSGYIDTSLLRSHPDADVRERTASFLMKEGRMSAGEFFAVTSPEEVALYGAEDNELYRKNVECFRNIHECNRENIVFINSILSKLRKVEEKVYSPSLARFIYRSRLHRQSRISFDVYWPALVAIASENGVELSGFEHINRFRASVSMEKDIDFKKATEERNRLMGELAGAVPVEEIEEMVSQAASFEKGKIDQYDFHKWLIAFATNKGFDTSGYSELAKYGEYIKGYRQLDVIGLSEELAGAEEKILDELLSNEKEKRLYELVRGLEAIRGLFEIQLLGDEVEIAKKAISGSFGEGLSAFLGREFAEPLSNALEKARADAAKAISFYEIAERRNTVMIANTIKSMRDEGKHVAALISGGYHSAGLTDLMKEKGLSYLVLMPKYNKDGERPYVAVLTKKAGPYREAARGSGYLALESYFDTGDITNLEEMIAFALGQSRISGKDPQKEISNWVESYREAYEAIPRARKELMAEPPVTPGRFEEFLVSSVVDGSSDEACTVTIGGNVYRVTRDKADHIGEDGTLGHSSGHPMSYDGAIAWQRGLMAFAFLFALGTIWTMVSAGTYLSIEDMAMYAGGALLLIIYLAAAQERFYRLAKAVDEAFAREGIDKEARRRLAIADHVSRHRVNRHPAFRHLSEKHKKLITLHEAFRSHHLGMFMLMPGLCALFGIKGNGLKGVNEQRQNDFINLNGYVESMELDIQALEYNRTAVSEAFSGVYAGSKMYVPVMGNTLRAGTGLRIKNWVFISERKPNLPVHIDVENSDPYPQEFFSKDIYEDVMSMLANLENSMLLWTNERSAKEDQTLHMHIFRKEIGPEAYRNKLPVEEAALTPIARNRKGEGVIFRLEDYPSRRDPIEVIALKGSVANEGDRGLLAARCFSAETIIRRNGYPVDKVFMKGADDNVIVYMFPRTGGHEVFFRFRKGQKKRPVGPLAMTGLWIMDNEAEYIEFTPRLAQNILANTAVGADSEEAISIEQNIKRDFEESEGIGILPGTFSMRPFEVMDQTGIKKYGRELIVRQRQIVERLWDGGVRRLNVDLGNWHGSLGDRHRWNAAHHILVCARRKGMTTIISIDQLPSNIDVLIPYRRYIDRSIMPHVDKISFRSDAAGEGFVRAVEFFDRFFPEKELEIFTYVNKANEEAVDSIGKVLAWRGKRSKHLTQWALVRDTSSEEGKSLSEERYDLITEGIERKFPGVNIRHSEKSPEAAEIFVNDKGVIRAPGVAPEGWTADIFDIEKLNSEQSRQVFKATTERLRMESIPAGVMDEYKDTKGPGLGTAVTLLPAVKRLCAAEIHARTEAEALIASKIIEKMGLSAPAAEVGVLAVWAYNIGLGPRSSNNQFFESVKSFLENKYPEAKSPNGKWDLETAVEMLIDGVVPKDAPLIDRFEAFAAEYARQTGREPLNHAQRLVALSVFASKQLSYDILGNRRIRLPHDAKTLVDHYGRYRKMQRYLNRIGAHKEWRSEYSSERLSPDEILKITAAIRVAGRFSSYTDNASQTLRGETPMSLSDSIETILSEFKANSENDEVTNGAVTSLVMLLADGDRDIMDTIERLSEGSQGEAKRAFLSFLRGSYERISMISSEEGPQKIIDDFSGYELGPSVSEYISAARFSFILAGGMFIVALASLSGIPASKAYLAGFAAAFLAGSYLIISGHNFLKTGHTIEKAIMKVRDGDPIFMKRIQEGKIRSYPFIKVFPDGTIDWKNDGFTRALMAELPDRVKKHIESIESYDTTREAILNDIPLRKWFRNKNRDLEIRQQKKAKKYMASMKKVVTYSSLDQGRMDRRKGEMDLSGGRWEWKYGDGVGVVALAGNSLRREVAAIQRELRDVVRSRMRQIAGRDPSEEEMNRVLQLTDPDTVHMTVSEDIPNTRQIDPSRADERVSMMRKISGILSDSKINVMFNVSDVSILEDGSILIFGREVDDSLETLRGAIAKETQGDETRRKRIQHITIGRIFDKEKLGQEAYYDMREILRMRSKRGVVEVPMDPSLRVWDQAGAFGTSGGGRYVEPREILDIFSERQEPSRDLSGTMAPESDQLIKSLIKDGRIAEVFLVKGQLAVRRIKYVEGHVPGRASAEDYLGEDLDPADIFTKEQAENIVGWMKGKTLPDERGDVRFRIILGGAAIGWNTDAEHISVSHAGYRDGVIYIGGRLLASIFTESHDPGRMLILDQDEYRHLTEKDFDCRRDTEAYKSRLSEAINRIKAINDTNPDRPRTDICPDAATARERHYGVDKEDPNIKWGNFTPQDKDLTRDDMSPVNVAASLFILDGTDVQEDRLRMKIWMGPDDNYFRWSEKKMQLVYRNIVEGGTVYYFEGELPAFFHGDFTFKYSVDGGTRWRWANRGPGDDLKLRRTMFDESKAKIGAYGLWRGDGQRADYKRAKIFTLYKGNVNLKALVDKARDVDDVFWETWKVPSGEASKNKVIFAGHSTDDEGNNEGSVLVMYNDMSRTISVIMRGDYEDAIIPGTDRKLSSTDWYRSVVEIRLDERFRAKEVFHRPELMGISRSGMALLMLHAGIDREEYAGLFRLLQEELVLYPVSPKMKLEDTYDMKPIEVGAIVKIMDDPDGALDISLDEIDSLERIIEFARSKTLTRLALACLEILAEQGRYRKDLYREKERYVTEKMVLEGMASVERVIRQDKTILREMGIDRAAVKSVAVRWFAGGVNKMIYRVTFRMHDKAAKVFAMEFMSPVRLGEDFMMTNVEKPINIWERKLSDAGFDFVPHVFSVKRISDYKPKILEEPLPRMAERTSNWDFAMDPAVMDPARALYDDTLIVAREYVEGQEALEYAASVSPNAEEEKRINLAALTAYLRMWKATKDPVTGRGAGLMEPDKSNVVVYVQSSGYHGMVADFHSLSYGLGLKDLIRMLHHNKFTKEECAEAARGVLNDEECALAGKVLEEIDEAHPDDMIAEERPFMLAVSDVPDETLQEVSRGILEYPERSGLKLNAEQQRLSMHGIKGALSYLAERINRNMDISPGIKDNLAITVDQMRRREIWTKVQYYKARWGHDLILGGRMPVYDMLYAFKHEDAFYLAEGFLDGTGVSREECVALVILRHIVAEMFPEKDRDELRDIVGKVIGEESTLHIDGLIKRYAARSYIKILLEDDVLGIGPEKDLITYQALADTREAARNAEEYLETVTWITMSEARLEDISSREALAGYLTKRFGVRKFIIAGGKGTRFSPEGIVVKQLFRPDNDNTNIKLSRISASFGKLDDVIVVDTVTLFNVIAADREIDEDTRALAADEAAEAVQEFVKEGVISKTEAARLIRDVTVKSKRDLRYSRRSDGLMDLAMFIRSITGSAKLILGESDERVQFVTDKIAYAVFKAVMKQENIIDEEKKDEFFGKNSIVILDAGDGHGSAYMEALERLEAEGKIGNARYSIIMHADSPGWGLEEYPDAVFITYLKTVNGLYPGSEELPKASIAVKNPVDGRAKNRARIFIDRTEEYGAIPLGIKEWNCMTEEERSGSSSMAASRDPNLLTNANILICDTPWAYSRREILRRDYRHMLGDQSRKKRRAYEYWSSDLLNIAASEYLERKTRGETAAPATRMVYFGQHAPNANKILKYALEYRDSLQEMITNKILAMGVDVDRYAEVSISSNEIIPGFDWDKAVHDIFKDNLSSDDGARALGNIKIRGRVHLDAAARVGRGAILDGSKDDIWLTGRTRVERGVEIHGVIAHDERITSDRIYEQEKKLVTSFPVNGYRTREATLVNNVDLSGLGFIADSRTRIWLIKSNRFRSDEEALMDIFGGEIEGAKVRDQIFLYGDIILEDTVRVESGTMLDGRSGGITLLGNTRVRKGTILKDVKARDTIFASRRGMDIYYYKQPTSIKEKFWLSDSVFENAYVEWSAKVQNSTVVNSCVMGEAQVLDSDIYNDLISQDSSVSGVRREDRENMLSALFSSGRNASLRYVPGAYRLDEFEEVDRNEVKNYQLAFAKRLYGMTIKNEYVLTRMTEDTERFLFSGAADCLTLQQIREYFFAKVRYNSLKYEGKEPGISEIKEFTDIMREYAGPYVKKAASISLSDREAASALLKEIMLKSARANLLDPSMDTGLFDMMEASGTARLSGAEKLIEEKTMDHAAIDGFAEIEKLVLTPGKGTFIFFPDNIGEIEFDAAIWMALLKLGHKVVVAPKSGFAFGDADRSAAEEMIEHYRLPGELRDYYLSGALKVVDSGSLGEGFIPHKMSRELFEALGDPELKAIISKGQANLFTLTSRNTVKVPVICLLLSKSRTSSKLTGIKLKKGKFWPVMVVVPSGESILSKIGKYDFSGTMKRFGRTDPEAEGGHAMTALDAKRWGFVIVSVFSGLTMLTVLASSILSVLSGNIWWSAAGMLVSMVSVMFSIGGFRYYSLSMDIFEAFRKYIFQGRDPGEPLSHEEQMTLKAAWETPIAYRESNDIIKYHPAFRNLLSRSVVFGREALRPETAQELVRLHESYRSHTVGMLAIFPVVGYIGRRLYAATFGRGEDRQYFIHSDFSNLDELINRQIEANRKTGFYKISEEEDLPGEGVFAEKNITLPSNGLELVKTEINVDHDKLNTMRKVMKDIGAECSFCRAVESPFLKEAPRSRMEDWAFSVEATPIFSKHIIAISADHVDQGAASPDVYYDAFRMMANLLSGPNGGLWQVSWPGRLGTTVPGHMHFSLFQRKTPPPVDSFEKEPICVDRQGHGVVYLVENYPDKENAVAAFLIKGRPDGPETNIFAKRCADLENIIRNSGYDVDKYLTRDEAGAINVFFYPRVGEVTTQKQKFYERKLGPLEMSGIWPEIKRSVMTGDEEGMSQQAIKEIMFALSQGSLTRYSPACLDLMEAIKRHFYESEGVGLFPPSMDLLVTDRCNLNCPICWGSNMPEFKARSVDEQKKMIDVMYENGMRRMIFTGGEPLLEEHLAELLKYAKDKGVTTWLFTNGILMDDARADEIMPFVDMISLSLDGHDDATNALNRRKGHFDAVMRVLDIMVRKFPHKDVQVLTVVTNRNKGDVRKIGALLRGKSRGLERFQWKLNYYKRIGRSHEEMASDKDVYLMSYGEFKELAVTTLREFSDMRVRYSPPEHDMAYLFVFPDGTLATTVNAQYIKFGNVLDPGTLANEANIKAFRQITDNIRQRAVYIPQKGAYAVPDFKKMNLMGKNGEAIIHRLHGMMLDDVSEHMRRVTRISMLIAERMNESGKAKIKQDSMALLRTAAMIHDVGSIEKHDKRLKSALSRIEKGIHAPGKPRIEMSGLSIAGWANEIAWRDASIPKQELAAAMEASRNLNDHYPLYRLYIKYTALGMPPEEDLSPEEEVVARNLYSHGKRSVDMLREKGIEIPDAVKLLVSYHHDYNGLEDKLDLMLFEQRITREEADILRLLEAILITADVFENGNNYYRRTKKSPGGKVESFDVTLDPVNGFMWKRYNETESIPDTRPLEALKELIAGHSKRNTLGVPVMDPELLDVIAEARKVPAGVDPLTAADRRMQARVFLEVLSGVKEEGAQHVGVKRVDVLPVAVGIPASLYRSLPQESLDDLKSMSGVVSVIPISDSPDKEKMIDELNRRTRKLSAINLLIDADAVPPGAGGKVGGQEIFLVVRDFIGKARETMPEVLDTTGASPRGSEEYGSAVGLEGRGIMDVRIRLLPEYRSYRINEKSLRQMRIESAYRQHDLDRPEYAGLADDDRRSVWHIVPYNTGTKQKYLFHYADGAQLESGRCPAIMPVGLEIEKRRHVQKVSRGTDMVMDVLFISVPRDDMTPEERLEFKKTVMDMWMLEGVVDEDKVILVERTNVGDEGRGISTQFFRDTLEPSLGRIDPKDCVARSLAGDIDAGTDEMTTLVLSSDAGNNFGQYEVMTNLLMDEFLRVQYLNRAILMNREDEKSVFIYIPRSGQVDLEDEIRHYYDMYEKQVLIKA